MKQHGNQGIDVSTWQGILTMLKWPDKESVAILRLFLGEAWTASLNKISSKPPAAGIACGAYHYCYATSTQAAKGKPEHF